MRYNHPNMQPRVSVFLSKLQELGARLPILTQWLKGPGHWIGLDVGSHSVKGVLVHSSPEGLRLAQAAAAAVALNADSDQQVRAIQQVLESLNSPNSPILTAVAGPEVVLRPITLPRMTPQEVKNALHFEAEKYIPFKIEETLLDFSIRGDRPGGRMELFLAAARKEWVKAHLALLSKAGVTPAVVDLESVALANAWEASRPPGRPQVVGIVHIGARSTILNFLSGSELEFSREIPLGGWAFTQAVADRLQVDLAQAEGIKCEPNARLPQVREALQTPWEEWHTQFRASRDFYENQFGHALERLLMSGGSTRLAGFQESVQEATGLPVEVWNPIQGLSVQGDFKPFDEGTLAVAIGLAIRGR